MQNVALKPRTRIFAHRGTTLLAPENTAAAFDLALQFESDVLETDVRLSKDGVVMVTHDETLERTTDGRGRVKDYSVAQLKKLDASCQFVDLDKNPYSGPKQRLLTLEELFERYHTVGINIDIKDKSKQAAEAVADVIARKTSFADQWVNIGSFHSQVIQHFRLVAPDVSTAATRQEVARLVFGGTENLQPNYQVLQIPTHYFGIQLDRKKLIKKTQRLGCEILHWTINDTTKMNRLLSRGSNGFVSDRPDLALAVFKELGLK